jgi:hypothetical protein
MSDDKASQCPAASLNAASLKLPPFVSSEAQIWFRRAETQFRLKNITQSTTKADYVLSSLPEDIFPRIAPWLDEQPAQLSYNDLKAHLLEEFCLKPAARAQKVLAMSSQPLGDLSARQAWYELQALMALPLLNADPDSKPKRVDLEREIWLQRLPENIRAALPGAEEMEMSELIDKADALIAADKAVLRFQRPMLNEVQGDKVTVINYNGKGSSYEWKRQQSYTNDRNRRGYITKSGICNHHKRWGNKAWNCVHGCKWPKNGASGR